MKKILSVPVAKEILELEKKEAQRAANDHFRWVLSGKISTWINGRQLNFQEQLSWEAGFVKRNLSPGVNNRIFVCLRCGECCYYSYLDNTRRLRSNCEKYFFVPRRIVDNKFLPAECKIHNDPTIFPDEEPPDPYSLPLKFKIIIKDREYEGFSEEKGIEIFGEDFWKIIKMRNTLCSFHSLGAQFGPCVDGVKMWEKEKCLHPDLLLPEGVEEQLEVVRLFREKVDELLEMFEKMGKEALEKSLAE